MRSICIFISHKCPKMNRLLISVIFYCLCLNFSLCERCDFRNTCQCMFQNGSIIDLTSIGYHDKPRFENMKPSKPQDNYTYFYNPCYSFKMPEDCSKGVAVCQKSITKSEYHNCGNSDDVQFVIEKGRLVLKYTAPSRETRVTLICSEEYTSPILNVIGETRNDTYDMTLTSRCACPDLCQASHLSAGSVLVIIFMIFVALYLVLGIIHSSLTRGAHGWELIPHYEFWADFPLLVRDGCVFVVSGCKPDTAYERI